MIQTPDPKHNGRIFYGTTTISEKGQVVIPKNARSSMRLKKGESLLVFSMGKDMLTLVKLSGVEKIASRLSEKLKKIDEVLESIKK